VAAERGLRIVGWTVDTHDWRGDPAEDMFARICPELESGGIVLAHDGLGPGALRGDTGATVRLTRLIGNRARRRGWRLEALR
jgi:peptidoglycan/xylan/chitin deacetylase (PgdA/CDA1 family)